MALAMTPRQRLAKAAALRSHQRYTVTLGLNSATRVSLFVGVCVFVSALYVYRCVREYRAFDFAHQSNFKKATELEPADSDYWFGLAFQEGVSRQDMQQSLKDFRYAIRLNPWNSDYWLGLAQASLASGDIAQERLALENALQSDPAGPETAWQVANFYVATGDYQRALGLFRVVLQNDHSRYDAVIPLLWRISPDIDVLLEQALPRDTEAYISLLRFLVAQKQLKAATSVWTKLISLKKAFPPEIVFPYFQFLIENNDSDDLKRSWSELATVDPDLTSHVPGDANLLVNGGFEERILNGGLDWLYETSPGISLQIDTTEFHSGTRSLLIMFDGNPSEAGIKQFVPVYPRTGYHLEVFYRAEELQSAHGPRLEIADAATGASLVKSDPVVGTTPWRRTEMNFDTGATTKIVVIRLIREAGIIRGKLWLDDLALAVQ
jgi:tetratricopeptide (TPR) repeat protein